MELVMKKFTLTGLLRFAIMAMFFFYAGVAVAVVDAYQMTSRWGPTVKREAQAVYGVNAPTPMFLGQIMQESGGNEKVKAWDGGMGLGQFMPATAKQIVALYPELGPVDPYNPTWAIRALVRFDDWIYKKMKGTLECDHWGASLMGYNAGPGYPMRMQTKSTQPNVWFGVTENINSGQSEKNFTYSRLYPRAILFTHQPLYTTWGHVVCDVKHPPSGKISF
jgi:hypothetical protein